MENKINIAELLKDCPKGMELDCTMFENVTFEGIKQDDYPIIIKMKEPSMTISLTENGCWNLYNNAKCVIFPKGKTTWEGFVPPCQFKDGDIVFAVIEFGDISFEYVAIFKQIENNILFVYCFYNYSNDIFGFQKGLCDDAVIRFATEGEKEKLFQTIKNNGYKWNEETKNLEKITYPKTYHECWKILGTGEEEVLYGGATAEEEFLFDSLLKLKRCRDAYWKIADDWKPVWKSDEDGCNTVMFCIKNLEEEIVRVEASESNTILAFPTAEMRDAFYENFKELIEICKELL